jgi:two-component system, cell cycle sensor histidine kinase and response regulator CckA
MGMDSALQKVIFPRRLHVQVGVIVLLLMLATIGLYAWQTIRAQSESLTRDLKDQTSVMAKNIADLSVNYLLTENFAAIETLLLKTAEFSDVLSISVTNKQGMVLSHVERGPGSSPHVVYSSTVLSPPLNGNPSSVINGDRIIVWEPIVEGSVFGWVTIEYGLQAITALHASIWRGTLLHAVPVLTVSILVLLLFLNRHVRAVERITEFSKRLQEQRGETIPVERSSYEIEQLVSALNHTSLKLHEQSCAINDSSAALRESEKKYRTLFEQSKDAIMIDSPADRIIDINPAGIELFGYASREELAAVDIANDLYGDPRDRDMFKQIAARQRFIRDHEVRLKKKNGEMLTVLITATTVYDAAGNVTAYQGILRDVTTERMLEDQLLQARKMEAVGQLTGGIAHDFNNILSAVRSYIYLLQKKMADTDPLRSYVDQILINAERATHLTQGLLAFSRKQVNNPKPVGLNEIVEKVEPLLRQVLGEQYTLETVLGDDDVTVMADSAQMEQVLVNFAANARDAMPAGGRLLIQTRPVELGPDFARMHGQGQPGKYALLTVADTGVGMDEKTRGKIFEPFFTTKEAGKGTGLGLSIVHGIIKQHNGFIEVSSEPGKGTAFTLYLPAKQTAKRSAAR